MYITQTIAHSIPLCVCLLIFLHWSTLAFWSCNEVSLHFFSVYLGNLSLDSHLSMEKLPIKSEGGIGVPFHLFRFPARPVREESETRFVVVFQESPATRGSVFKQRHKIRIDIVLTQVENSSKHRVFLHSSENHFETVLIRTFRTRGGLSFIISSDCFFIT